MTFDARTDESFKACPDAARWSAVLARLGRERAVNLDVEIGRFDPDAAAEPGRVVFPEPANPVVIPEVSHKRPAIGVVVSSKSAAEDAALAGHLAALAIERECEVIILTEDPLSGFERFGFRTERIAGESDAEKAACLEQIRSFWGLEIVL